MASAHTLSPTATVTSAPEPDSKWRPLRIWPVVLLLLGMAITKYAPTAIEDGPAMLWAVAAFGPLLMCILMVLWWLVASRARWFERVLGFFGILGTGFLAAYFVDPTLYGPAIMVYMIPVGVGLFGIGAIVCSRMLSIKRTLVAILLAAGGFGSATLLRADGMWGHFAMGFNWRWKPTSEEQLAGRIISETTAPAPITADALLNPAWPAFRGSQGNSRVHGTQLASDWSTNPPKLIWKSVVGRGWSSFVVAGDWLFTQEQRSNMEAIVCYEAATGQQVWTQQIESRFEDPLGGPGPRATPTLSNGKLFTLGGQGWLLCLNPLDGTILWQQDLRQVAGCAPPMWGFSSSPLAIGEVVVVYAGGENDKGVLAFNSSSGELAWSAACGQISYSSPQLCNIAGEDSIAMLTNSGLTLIDPQSGKIRLNYDWSVEGYRSLQPQMVDENSILIPSGMGVGTRLVRIDKSGENYATKDVWTSRHLKPDFNDFVIYNGHAYGFDALIFTCIDLKTGQRKWKGGRYGKGQVLLAEDSGLLMIAAEQGDLVLLKADPEKHTELGLIKAIEGRTWNHPVLIGNRLYIRNSQAAACYELPLANGASATDVAGFKRIQGNR